MEERQERILVGMDAHSVKIELCVTRWRLGGNPVPVKKVTATLDRLVETYRRHVPAGALTVLEASTNAFSIHRRLRAAGYEAVVACSEIASGLSRGDRVNDRIDAENIAVAYARSGGSRAPVWVPDERHQAWRNIWFGYRNATKDAVRCANRIWGYCSGQGLPLPKVRSACDAAAVKAGAEKAGWTADQLFALGELVEAHARAAEARARHDARIRAIVAETPEMLRLTQILGIRFIAAFALVAFIEDPRRFSGPKKLASYVGLNPRVCESGKDACRRHLGGFGRGDLRRLLCEAAQSAYAHGTGPLTKWAKRKVAGKKPYNLVICALARKITELVWHVLMGHAAPVALPEPSFRRKLLQLGNSVGGEWLGKNGYAGAPDFADAVCARLFPLAAAAAWHAPQGRGRPRKDPTTASA